MRRSTRKEGREGGRKIREKKDSSQKILLPFFFDSTVEFQLQQNTKDKNTFIILILTYIIILLIPIRY